MNKTDSPYIFQKTTMNKKGILLKIFVNEKKTKEKNESTVWRAF